LTRHIAYTTAYCYHTARDHDGYPGNPDQMMKEMGTIEKKKLETCSITKADGVG